MVYLLCISTGVLFLGAAGVACNPSPLYGAMGLVVAVLGGCGLLAGVGGGLFSLMLLIVYLGGMLVVFAYSVAMTFDAYLLTWGWKGVKRSVLGYCIGVVWACVVLGGSNVYQVWGWVGCEGGWSSLRGGLQGVMVFYFDGAAFLLVAGVGLMLSLFVVLELTRGLDRGCVRLV